MITQNIDRRQPPSPAKFSLCKALFPSEGKEHDDDDGRRLKGRGRGGEGEREFRGKSGGVVGRGVNSSSSPTTSLLYACHAG